MVTTFRFPLPFGLWLLLKTTKLTLSTFPPPLLHSHRLGQKLIPSRVKTMLISVPVVIHEKTIEQVWFQSMQYN